MYLPSSYVACMFMWERVSVSWILEERETKISSQLLSKTSKELNKINTSSEQQQAARKAAQAVCLLHIIFFGGKLYLLFFGFLAFSFLCSRWWWWRGAVGAAVKKKKGKIGLSKSYKGLKTKVILFVFFRL